MPVGTVHNWGAAVQTAFADGLAILFAGIPKIIGFIVILAIGWIVASLVAAVADRVLKAVRFNQVADRAGIGDFIQKMGGNMDPAGFVADVVKWFIRLIVLVAAFDVLGLPQVSGVLNSFVLWIPNLIVALVVLVIGGLLARAAYDLVRATAAESGLGNPSFLGSLAQYAVWAFAIIVAVNQIGVAKELVDTLFTGLVAAVALALGLSFGLGGRETAAQIVQNWYKKSQQINVPTTAPGVMQETRTVTATPPATPVRAADETLSNGRS